MIPPPIVEVTDLYLTYRVRRNRPPSLKEYMVQLPRRTRQEQQEIRALDGVSFAVQRGEVFAVIGHNGAGKSTLMKVVSRILHPTSGRVVVRGRTAPMIELGAGFNAELTAAENIVLYGALLGREPARMRERIMPIGQWAGLEDVLDVPIRSYSTGMLARLGFAVATDEAPDLLVVDEVLSVGDESFQRTSRQRMEDLLDQGTSVLLVSHSLTAVEAMADRVLWLDHGRVKALGTSREIVPEYRSVM